MSVLTQLYAQVEKYKGILGKEFDLASKGPSKYQQLAMMAEPDRARVISQAYTAGPNQRIDFVYPADENTPDELEEIVLKVQGYAIKVNLPPITSVRSLPKNIRSLRQLISISGLGVPQFEKCAEGILAIGRVLESQVPSGNLRDWKPIDDHGHLCLEFFNRYFSSSEEANGRPSCPMDDALDPFHIIANANPPGIHTEDNTVLYFERREFNKPGAFKYFAVAPTAIKEGYLLELQVGFVAVPIQKGQYLLLPKLRSVCILDREVEHDANQAIMAKIKASTVVKKTLKRTVGYADTDEANSEEISTLTFKRLRLENEEQSMELSL